jgi:hypothetical protein
MWKHAGMTDTTTRIENPLPGLVTQLRGICEDRDTPISASDAGSVQRIAIHITNINSSVMASTRDYANAAKRLNDFAATLARMARKTPLPDDTLTNRMRQIAASLRGASDELAGGGRIPGWVPAAPAE